MASTSKAKRHKKDDADCEDFEDVLLFDMPMDYQKEKVIAVSFGSVKDPFLTRVCNDESEFMVERNEHPGDGFNLVHLDDNENDIDCSVLVHDPTKEWNVMEPKLGEKYESFDQLKTCLVNYAVAHGYRLWYEKLESNRLVARCGRDSSTKKCPFRLYASWMNTERTVQIKSMKAKHKCSRSFTFGHLVTPEWLGSHIVKELVLKPTTKLKELQEFFKKKFKISISTSKCNRAKQKAMLMIEGKISDHYARIWDYATEIKRSNPGCTVQVGVNINPDGNHYFHRFYVCFHALKTGWKNGCRRVIGLDGCFLKGQIKGELLSAIGRDANNQVYPICWAVMDIENKQN